MLEQMWILPKVGWVLNSHLVKSYCDNNYKFIRKQTYLTDEILIKEFVNMVYNRSKFSV